jgi:hypothetical protein
LVGNTDAFAAASAESSSRMDFSYAIPSRSHPIPDANFAPRVPTAGIVQRTVAVQAVSRPLSKAAELARDLVAHECSGTLDTATVAGAVETVCRRLRDYLTDLLGAGGVVALMGRALKLAKREHPVLAGTTLGTPPPSVCFDGLEAALAAGTAEDAVAAGSAVLAHVFDLLIQLIGEDLSVHPVRKLWPDLKSGVMENDE